jgi:hypothetical protein
MAGQTELGRYVNASEYESPAGDQSVGVEAEPGSILGWGIQLARL